MTKTAELLPLLLPILRTEKRPMDSVCLARLVGAVDSSSCYRALMSCPDVTHISGQGLTMFQWKGPA